MSKIDFWLGFLFGVVSMSLVCVLLLSCTAMVTNTAYNQLSVQLKEDFMEWKK